MTQDVRAKGQCIPAVLGATIQQVQPSVDARVLPLGSIYVSHCTVGYYLPSCSSAKKTSDNEYRPTLKYDLEKFQVHIIGIR